MIQLQLHVRRVGRKAAALAGALALAGTLAGCANLATLDSVVLSYGQWPAARAPGTYAFERLPSQQANPERQQLLEVRRAERLQAGGFPGLHRPAPGHDQAVRIVRRPHPDAPGLLAGDEVDAVGAVWLELHGRLM